MKRSGAVTFPRRLACGVALGVIAVAACKKEEDRQPPPSASVQDTFVADNAGAAAACNPPTSAATRAGFAQWAGTLRYVEVDSNHARLHGFTPPAGESVRLEITSPARSRADVTRGCVIGRIVSTYADPAFGLIDGTTYVWADSSSPNSVQLVPEDPASAMTGYNLAVVEYTEGEPIAPTGTPPKHVCQQCSVSDWCVYPRDGLREVEPLPPNVTSPP